jgi:hypothetical protein
VHELDLGVSNGSHSARSRPLLETSEIVERVCEATSAEGTASCGSRGQVGAHRVSAFEFELGNPLVASTSLSMHKRQGFTPHLSLGGEVLSGDTG